MSDARLRKYGVETTIPFELFEVSGITFRVDAAYTVGDVKIMKDEGAEANTTNSFTDEGTGYSLVLTAAEMTAARIVLYAVDQTATKVWIDREITIETYGNASAQHAFDLDTATVDVGKWLGTTVATPTTAGVPSTALTAIGLDAIVSTATGMVEIAKAVWDRLLTGLTHNIKNSAGKLMRQIAGTIWTDGTAQSGGNNFIQLASGDIATDGQYQRAKVILVDGTGAPAEAIITGSTAIDDIVTTTPAWLINPDVTTDYQVIPGQAHTTVNDGGYDNGRIYVNFVEGSAGTVPGVNGTIKTPSSVLSDARIIADREKSKIFDIKGGGAFSLDQSYINWVFDVINAARITLNGKDISGSAFFRTGITGVGVGTSRFVFELCGLFNSSVDTCNLLQTGIGGTITLTSEDSYFLWDCFQTTVTTPIIDVAGDGVTPTVVFLLNYSGEVELQNMTSVDTVVMTGQGHVTLNANCSGGDLIKAGDVKYIDNSGNVAITTSNIDDTLALLNDPRAEPGQGALAVNASMAEKVDYLYKLTRNLKDNDGTTTNFYNDAGSVVDHKQTTSSAAGTVSKTEIISGP